MSGILAALAGIKTAIATAVDEYFNRVTLLLPGDGTNGAQNNTFLDSSSNNFTITRNGNTTQGTFSPFSQTGWSNYFDGSSYLSNTSPTSVIAPGTSNFTAEFWVYATTDQQSQAYGSVLHIGNSSSGAWAIALLYSSSGAMKIRFSTTVADYDSASTIATNQWYHIAVVRSGTGSNQTTVYVNGASFYTFTLSDNLSNSSGLYIGSTAFNVSVRRLSGYVSNLRLTVGTALYTGTFTPSTTPLTTTSQGATATQVELLTCQDNRFIDNSSNNFSLTITGTPFVQAFSPFAPTAAYSAATNGGSGYFDGTGDYLTTPTNAGLAFGSGDFALEFWLYTNSFPSTDGRVLGNATTWAANAWSLHNDHGSHNEKFSFWVNNYNSSAAMLVSTSSVIRNQWYHVAITRSGSTWRMFVNGALEATQTSSVALDGGSSDDMFICGSGAANEYVNGYLSGLRGVKGSAVYTSAFTPPTAPPTAITNTQLLLNFTNAGITDATAKNNLETVGNAQISTTQSKFGGSSMYFDGTGDYLVGGAFSNPLRAFGTGDFTIEGWFYTGANKTQIIVDTGTVSGSTSGMQVALNASGYPYFFIFNSITITSSIIVNLGTWTHVAWVRSNGVATIYVNGVSGVSTANTSNITDTGLTIGTPNDYRDGTSTYHYNGYIDDLRITKGHARYTANFTPPTQAFALQ